MSIPRYSITCIPFAIRTVGNYIRIRKIKCNQPTLHTENTTCCFKEEVRGKILRTSSHSSVHMGTWTVISSPAVSDKMMLQDRSLRQVQNKSTKGKNWKVRKLKYVLLGMEEEDTAWMLWFLKDCVGVQRRCLANTKQESMHVRKRTILMLWNVKRQSIFGFMNLKYFQNNTWHISKNILLCSLE